MVNLVLQQIAEREFGNNEFMMGFKKRKLLFHGNTTKRKLKSHFLRLSETINRTKATKVMENTITSKNKKITSFPARVNGPRPSQVFNSVLKDLGVDHIG